jgi:cholera toxin transcriptional activator
VADPLHIVRFGQFELDSQTGELRKGPRTLRLQDQPLKILLMLLESPGTLVTREEMKQKLWAEDTFVDFEHSLSTAINKLRTALGDSATDSRYIETLPRKGYRFIAPVQATSAAISPQPSQPGAEASADERRRNAGLEASAPEITRSLSGADPNRTGTEQVSATASLLTDAADVPAASPTLALGIFAAIQLMYLAFYISTLAGLHELQDRLANIGAPGFAWIAIIALAAIGIPVRLYFLSSAGFKARTLAASFLKVFPFIFVFDELWAASPLLIIHYIGWGWALAAVAGLAYLPFSQRTLLLMADRPTAR